MLLRKLLKRIEALELDLRGKTVLTEAATGFYVVTPLIAALAGAKVYAYARNSRYGTVEEVFGNTRNAMQDWGAKTPAITFIDTLTPEIISEADIITNSGHLRPLNEEMLRHAKDGMVIPLMYEAWEWREADMDINYVRQRGFKLGATNERHPDIDVFSYLGDMALKQIFDAGICLYQNKFVLLCNNDFGPYIAKVVARNCSGLAVIDTEENKSKYDLSNIDWIGGYPDVQVPEKYKDAEAIIFTGYPFDQEWIGENSAISIKQIKESFDHPYILRYCGHADPATMKAQGVDFFPEYVPSGHMGVLPSAIGWDPVIRLQGGGIKVGEALATGNYKHRGIDLLELI
jgi:hypothetical protein